MAGAAGIFGMGGAQGAPQGGAYAQQAGFANQYLSTMGQQGAQASVATQQELVRMFY